MDHYETVWSFSTARFRVELAVTDEEDAPDFELDEDNAFASEGGWHWFAARVRVVALDSATDKNWLVPRNRVLGEYYLGGCSYHGMEDFRRDGYFYAMVRGAITEARTIVGGLRRAA